MEIGFLQEIKAIIKSLVVSYPHQISIDKLNKDFVETEGHSIPYGKLGYKNLESFLRSISDTVTIHGHGTMATVHYVANQKANHIHDMIKSQKKAKRPRTRNSKPMSHNQSFIVKSDGHRNDWTNGRFGSHSTIKRHDGEINSFSLHAITRNAVCFNDNHNRNRTANHRSKPQTQTPHVSTHVYDPQHKTLSEIIQKREILPAELATMKTVNTVDKVKDSLKKQIASIKPKEETIEVKRHIESNKQKIVDKVEELVELKSYDLNPTELKKEITNITDKFTGSVNVTAQQNSAISNKQSDLTVEKNLNERNGQNTDFFTLSYSSKENIDDMDEAVPLFAANNLVFRLDFPENTVVFGKKIKPFTLPSDIKKGSIIGIFISEIHNPFKFWFHIHKENHQLDFLMHNIERFYNSLDSDEFVIPLTCHTPGQICAALYNNLWHRAEIIGNPIKNQTKVFFLDYGTVSDVSVDNIKYLASMFATIPSQAVRGSLSHIKPRGLHWTHEATKYFLSIVCELMLYGQVTEIDEKNRTMHMVICNTNGSEITQVNKMMVENKFAQYDEEWMHHRIEQNGLRWHHIREDFPTFEMLEKGEYPSLSEVVDLLNRNIDYERIIDRKMFHHGKMNYHENAPEALRNLPFILLNTNPFRCDIILELHRRIKLI